MLSQIGMKEAYKKECHAQRNKNLIYLREKIAKLNLTTFANEIGIAKTNLSDIEKGDRDLSIGNLHSYKFYFQKKHNLNISMDFLLGYTDMINNDNMNISRDLRLSRDAINTLKNFSDDWANILSYMLEDGSINVLLESIIAYYPNWYNEKETSAKYGYEFGRFLALEKMRSVLDTVHNDMRIFNIIQTQREDDYIKRIYDAIKQYDPKILNGLDPEDLKPEGK